MANQITAGDLVVAELWSPSVDRIRSAAVAEEVYSDGTVRVRLTGLVPAPYDPGMVLAIDGDKVRKAGW